MNENSSRDPIIGLELGGRSVFYCNRSTLTNEVGSYFAVRFDPDSMMFPGESRTDEHGRQVYFIDRNPDVFPHIVEYLRTKKILGMPDFDENRSLWPQLREEATFYSLDGLSSLLKVTYSCSPEHTDQGVLYWLGTRKGATEYQNPLKIGAVHVGGWTDHIPNNITTDPPVDLVVWSMKLENRASFVQYRPETFTQILSEHGPSLSMESLFTFTRWCDGECLNSSAVIDLRDVRLRPTYYSLRAAECSGMNADWNFEASNDGISNWEVIHEGRSNDYIGLEQAMSEDVYEQLNDAVGVSQASDFAIIIAEKCIRRTWDVRETAVNPEAFYRFFRIRKVGSECFHCVGLEMFGDVYES